MEVVVLRRSDDDLTWCAAGVVSLTADVPLDNQEKGIVSFLAGGGLGTGVGIEPIDFELCERAGNLGGGPRAFSSLPFDVVIVERELASVDSSSSWTSSSEDVDSRRAVSNGDFEPTPSNGESLASLSVPKI